MKKTVYFMTTAALLMVTMALAGCGGTGNDTQNTGAEGVALAANNVGVTGNGAPSGAHYNLNLLGKDHCPGDDRTGTSTHSIMVLLNYTDADYNNILGDEPGNYVTLDKRNKIFLSGGDDFQVTDGNACDNHGASFTLPWNVSTDWQIYVRELGKPGGTGDIRTCGISAGTDGIMDTADDEIVCSTNNVELQRNKGKSVFTNETKTLTTIQYQIPIYDAEGNVIGYQNEEALLFDPDFYQYYWDYDNNGLRLVQLRFYPAAQ
jgi:hypothetical protein